MRAISVAMVFPSWRTRGGVCGKAYKVWRSKADLSSEALLVLLGPHVPKLLRGQELILNTKDACFSRNHHLVFSNT